ncbi:hypothetical protein B0T20DRAFT_498069 [Sordaria brevicollis]|uniref:Uncharacterized protein n=1 Tax=Sordaria brevicollis TaxID=83679 RepID=A0AAE0PE34_SORBR|nr:hypothetical protein B0T20DRAFT_498069 [Sordaria brevicollis]
MLEAVDFTMPPTNENPHPGNYPQMGAFGGFANETSRQIHQPRSQRSQHELEPGQQIEGLQLRYSKLEAKTDKLMKALHQFRGVLDDSVAETKSLKRKIAMMEDEPQETQATLRRRLTFGSTREEDQQAEHQSVSDEKETEYKTQIQQLEAMNQHLNAQNNMLCSETTDLRKKLQDQTTEYMHEMAELRATSFNPVRVSSMDIEQDWERLSIRVRDFVYDHMCGDFGPAQLEAIQDTGGFKVIKKLCANRQEALRCKWICASLLQSTVWEFLYSQIFGPRGRMWCGDVGRKFGVLYQEVSGLIRTNHNHDVPQSILADLNDWRSRSTNFLLNVSATKESHAQELAGELVDSLTGFFSTPTDPSDSQTISATTEEITKDANEIISSAANLDLMLRKPRSEYTLFFRRYTPLHRPQYSGYAFDPSRMEQSKMGPRVTDATATVDFAVAPGLMKAGNDDGEMYKNQWVVVKMEVVCNMEELLNLSNAGGNEAGEEVSGNGE